MKYNIYIIAWLVMAEVQLFFARVYFCTLDVQSCVSVMENLEWNMKSQ